MRRTIHHDELPPWARDNEYITRGYRAPGGTVEHLRGSRSSQNGHQGVSGSARVAKNASKTSHDTLDRRRKPTHGAVNGESKVAQAHDGIFEHASFQRCWSSVWSYLHNETVNIHTHLWGAVVATLSLGLHILGAQGRVPAWLHPITHHPIFYPHGIEGPSSTASAITSPLAKLNQTLSMFAGWESQAARSTGAAGPSSSIGHFLSSPEHTSIFPWGAAEHRPNDWKDVLGYTTYLLGAITVLSCSATFHTVSCHSKEIAHSFNKLDYIGIVAMIVGSFLPMLHYGFYCHEYLQLMYSIAIVSLGSFAMYTVLSRKYATPAYRPIRTGVFVALGLSAIFPVTHIMAMYGHEAVSRTMGLDYLVAGGALYVIGAGLYVARVPERLSPGTFDYFGASHQIFHVLIIAAAFCHYVCIRRAYTFWHTVEALGEVPSSPREGHDAHSLAVTAVCTAFEQLRYGR